MNPAEDSQKGFLGQVFGFLRVFQHANTQSKDSAAVQPIEPFKCRNVAFQRKSSGLGFRHVVSLRLWQFSHKILPSTRVSSSLKSSLELMAVSPLANCVGPKEVTDDEVWQVCCHVEHFLIRAWAVET